MARMISIEKTMEYNLDEIMAAKGVDEETAIEIAYDYFDEASAESFVYTDDDV